MPLEETFNDLTVFNVSDTGLVELQVMVNRKDGAGYKLPKLDYSGNIISYITTLPVGFRPAFNTLAIALVIGEGVNTWAYMFIHTDGGIYLYADFPNSLLNIQAHTVFYAAR